MIFSDDIKQTMYALDIIDSIMKTPAEAVLGYESALRYNWVERFIKEGGFQQLTIQLNRALALSKDTLMGQDRLSEKSNIAKKFVDQMLRLIKTFIFAVIQAGQDDDFLLLRRNSSVHSDKKEKKKAAVPQEDAHEE